MEYTDKEIVKALECCKMAVHNGDFCELCPYYKIEDCAFDSANDILDLIARQQAEIDRLKKQLDDKCDKCIVRDRAEAIKEFADRLKNLWYDNRYDSPDIEFDYFVDNLVKKMTQED